MTGSELEPVAAKLKAATHPEDVFGSPAEIGGLDGLSATYRRLAIVVHPDHYANDARLSALATEALLKLNEMRRAAEFKLEARTYGDRGAPSTAPAKPGFVPVTLTVKGVQFVAETILCEGDLATVYRTTLKDAAPGVLKVVGHPRDNDLLQNEATVLGELFPQKQDEVKFFRYLPRLVDSFVLRSASSSRRVNVLARYDELHSLEAVRGAYPDGIDFRDAAWMVKRMLEGLGFVHQQGFVHGAVLPPHVLVHPVHHGAKFIDWAYAVRLDGKECVKAISTAHRDFYAPEILAKLPATSGTDIFMWSKCAIALLGGNVATNALPSTVPAQLRRFLHGCLLQAQRHRPNDAWQLHEELSELLQQLVGKPKYRPFHMPGGA